MQNRYSLWVYILLAVLIVWGVLYALPNLYGEDPSLQMSANSGEAALTSQVLPTIRHTLEQQQLAYKSIEFDRNQLLIRFANTDLQLKAQDVLKKTFPQYTFASNLAPATPAWLRKIGATPMKQGLDLRGGVHFLLEVDVESVVVRRVEGLLKEISDQLRQSRIRYSSLRPLADQGLRISFKNEADRDKASDLLMRNFSDLNFTKESSTSGYVINISLGPKFYSDIRQYTIDQTITTLRNRVNELGVAEAVVQQQGANRVAVDLPGIQDAARAKQILGGTATLEFHLVDDESPVSNTTVIAPVGTRAYTLNGQPLLLKNQVVLSGNSITSAISNFDAQNGQPAVDITLGGGGEGLFTRITKDNVGKRLAIVYIETKTDEQLIDGKMVRTARRHERIISAPVIQSALGNRFQITGLTNVNEAKDLALLLRAGALPATIYYVEERIIGPSLGKENIRRGIVSLEVGTLLILIIMALYYRGFGLIANIALLVNLILLVAILSFIDATMTLPAIAGIVLTMGIAVDANVLINERIREELRNGAGVQSAISAGYERAFSTIVDANMTALIVAIILFAIGTGAIRGFAITLGLGLLTSMLTGVVLTRAIVNLWYGNRRVKKISIGI